MFYTPYVGLLLNWLLMIHSIGADTYSTHTHTHTRSLSISSDEHHTLCPHFSPSSPEFKIEKGVFGLRVIQFVWMSDCFAFCIHSVTHF